jgi:UDP-N-acetylmuramyl pentapeptide phosphotransferase/UDP-N-acetylglucosamine-1-phosphate transferase
MSLTGYLLLFCLLLALAFGYVQLARRLQIIDRPGARSSHSRPTVRGGGIIFPVAAIIWFFIVGWESPWAIAGLSLIALVSFIDDLKPLPGGVRLAVHLVAVLLLFYQLGLFNMYWYWFACALVLAIGCINAFNFMDGINGITAGYALVSLGTFSLLNNAGRLLWPVFPQAAAAPGLDSASRGLTSGAETPSLDSASQGLTYTSETTGLLSGGAPGPGLDFASGWTLDVPGLLGSESFLPPGLVGTVFVGVLVFTFFNARRRALAFAGDVGSISLAFLLSWMMIELMVFTHQAYWLLLFAVYGIDTSVTILIRLSQKKNIFKPHRQHLYQLLANEHGWPHLKVAAAFAAVQGGINLLVIFLVFTGRMNWVTFLVLSAVLTIIYATIRHQVTKSPSHHQHPTSNSQ